MIEIKNLTKEYKIFKRRLTPFRLMLGTAREGRDYDLVRSLDDINLEIAKGAAHGIIGMNGAGKSTLLKILSGVVNPTTGYVHMGGRVAALLELGTGFHADLSGRANIFLNGAIMGLSQEEIAARLPEIEAFAEIGEFFDRPVKIYSSGMYVRLAFAFAIAVKPEILIIDEALAVGDVYFQQKCLKKIQEFKQNGVTILLVSHDFAAIKLLCDQVTLLSKGRCLFTGKPLQGLDLYNELLSKHSNEAQALAKSTQESLTRTSGTKEIEITEVLLRDEHGNQVQALVSGQLVHILIHARVNATNIENPTCGILIRDRLGYDVFGTNSAFLHQGSGTLHQGHNVQFEFVAPINLGPGDYSLTVALHSDTTHMESNYHWLERALIFKILPSSDFSFIGVARLEPHCHIRHIGSET